MRTRVKICGFTRSQDALLAADLGVDAIGLVFYAPSRRFIELAQAREIVHGLTPFVTVVALFVNAQQQQVEKILNGVRVDLLQFHGEEEDSYCAGFGLPFMKSIAVKNQNQVAQAMNQYPNASGFLLDRFDKHQAGGTGARFDWSLVPKDMSKPLILAGGLNAENVGAAVTQLHPYAVDVSSGVEDEPGVKSGEKMRAFVASVYQAGSGDA